MLRRLEKLFVSPTGEQSSVTSDSTTCTLDVEYDYIYEGGEVPDDLKKTIVRVKIDAGVTVIDEDALNWSPRLESVYFPEDSKLEVIGPTAFELCVSLSTVLFPERLKSISRGAFRGCSSLTNIYFPEGLVGIEDSAFERCSSLTIIHFPDSLTHIGKYAFANRLAANTSPPLIAELPSHTRIDDMAFPESTLNENELRTRYDDLPLHRACYRANLREIRRWCGRNHNFGITRDPSGLFPIHILASHPQATKKMIELVCEESRDAITDTANPVGSALHFAALNPGKHVMGFLPLLTKARTPGQRKFGFTLQNKGSKTATILSVMYNPTNRNVREYLFSCEPCDTSHFERQFLKDRVSELETAYVNRITSKRSNYLGFSFQEKHGWVNFVNDAKGESREKIRDFIRDNEKCPKALVRELAEATDDENRQAIDVAVQEIKLAFFDRLLFLGRYEIKNRAPVHKSETCIVVEAADVQCKDDYEKIFEDNTHGKSYLGEASFRKILKNLNVPLGRDDEVFKRIFETYVGVGSYYISRDDFVDFCNDTLNQGNYRKVAIKFMKIREEFLRENERRIDLKEQTAVIEIIKKCDPHEDDKFAIAMNTFELPKSEENHLSDYNYAIVMPFADRDFDTISRCEQPSMMRISADTKQIADKLHLLHQYKIAHGDLKMGNILRVHENLILTDLDASAIMNDFIGKKFTSGVLPPEMIFRFSKPVELDMFEEYFREDQASNHYFWEKIKPKKARFHRNAYFVVKIFKTDDSVDEWGEPIEEIRKGLPYEPIRATPAFDLWSFGTILFFLCAKKHLFELDVHDDLADGNAMEQLYNWTDERRDDKLDDAKIQNKQAKELLRRLLSRDPAERGTTKQLLEDPFFREFSAGNTVDGSNNALAHRESAASAASAASIVGNVVRNELKKEFRIVNEKIDGIRDSIDSIIPMISGLEKKLELSIRMTQTMLENVAAPRYFCIIPEGVSIENMFDVRTFTKKSARIYFVCPVTFSVPRHADGKPMGYEFALKRNWFKKYGPALYTSLTVLRIAYAIGRLSGLPLPPLAEGDSDVNILELMTDNISEYSENDGEDPNEVGDAKKAYTNLGGQITQEKRDLVQRSYEEIKIFAQQQNDPEFLRSGLSPAFCQHDGSREYVLNDPTIKTLYENEGQDCVGLNQYERLKKGVDLNEVLAEGSLKKENTRKRKIPGKSNWKERYFVLRKNGLVTYYDTKDDKEKDNLVGIKGKPLPSRVTDIVECEEKNVIVMEYDDNTIRKFKILGEDEGGEEKDKWLAAGKYLKSRNDPAAIIANTPRTTNRKQVATGPQGRRSKDGKQPPSSETTTTAHGRAKKKVTIDTTKNTATSSDLRSSTSNDDDDDTVASLPDKALPMEIVTTADDGSIQTQLEDSMIIDFDLSYPDMVNLN